MYKTGSLLLVGIVVVALMAPPAGSQSRKLTLEDVATDVIQLQSYVKEMQRTADAKNAETKAALDQILGRFTSIDSSLQKLGDALAAIKTEDEKTTRELVEIKAAVKATKDTLDKLNLGETLLDIKNGVGGLKTQISNLQNTEAPLPTSRQAYDSAYGLFSQAFFDDAITEFRDFVKAYPRDPKAPRAQLHIGMSYVNQKKPDQAVLAFDEAIQNYPESDIKCTALYKKGLALKELKQVAPAKAVFQSVVKECPNTDEYNLAAAKLRTTPARGARG
jgi:tol-pal system protein YbgF